MQKYENTSIYKIIEDINIKYFLPDIQRPYVWKKEQIYALYDSIMRGYPINTFLFWEQSADVIDKLTPRYEFLTSNKKEYEDKINTSKTKETYSLVLDGQQRLTSLYLTLKGNFVIRNKLKDLYFNILSGKEEDENGNIYEFKLYDMGSENIFFSEDDKLWINIKHIYSYSDEYDLEDFVDDYISINCDFELSRDEKRSSKRLYSILKHKEIINYYPEREDDMDRVLDIFVRTNAGGTKLSKSDLLFSTIKRNWKEAREEFKLLLRNINKIDKYKFSHDFLLKTCLVLFADTQSDIKYSVNNVKSLIKEIRNDWKNIANAIRIVVDEVDSKYKLSSNKVISSYNALIPLIYFVYKNKLKIIDSENSLLMRRWLIKILLNGIFGGQADTMLHVSKKAIDDNKGNKFPYKEINQKIVFQKKSFNSIDEILNNPKLKYNSNDSFLLLSLLYSEVDFNTTYSGNLPQQDHIYAQAKMKKANIPKEKIDSIFNIQYLDAHTNKSKNDMSIDIWLNTLSLDERENHLIPDGNWNIEDYDTFIQKRKKLFKEKLKNYI